MMGWLVTFWAGAFFTLCILGIDIDLDGKAKWPGGYLVLQTEAAQ